MKGPSNDLPKALSSKLGFLGGPPGQERGLVPLQPQPEDSPDKGAALMLPREEVWGLVSVLKLQLLRPSEP